MYLLLTMACYFFYRKFFFSFAEIIGQTVKLFLAGSAKNLQKNAKVVQLNLYKAIHTL